MSHQVQGHRGSIRATVGRRGCLRDVLWLLAVVLPWSKLCAKDANQCLLRRDVSFGSVRTMWVCTYYEAESMVFAEVALRHLARQRVEVRPGGRRARPVRAAIEARVGEVTKCLDDQSTAQVQASAVIDADGDVVDI